MLEDFRNKSISPKSNYKVGAVIHTNLGNKYGGFNIEFDKIEHTLHAEQTSYINFLMNKSVGEYPTSIDVSAAPCGHCRQFLSSLGGSDMLVNFGDDSVLLSELLPHPFGGCSGDVFIEDMVIDFNMDDPIEYTDYMMGKSINKFTKFKGGCVIETYDETLHGGFFIENDAFNPSINPVVMAMCNLYLSGGDIDSVENIYLNSTGHFDITSPLTVFGGVNVINLDKPNKENLKNYSKYLLDEYSNIMFGDGGSFRIRLEQFYSEGRVKDIVAKNSKLEEKRDLLNHYRERLLTFAKSHGKKITLHTYSEFSNE
jgi:cytidine deaminase